MKALFLQNWEAKEEEEICNVEEQIVRECVKAGEEVAEKGPFSDDCDDEDEADTEGASDSSDVDTGKL